MFPTAQVCAAVADSTNTPVACEHVAESIADTAIASQSEVYLKLSKEKGQQLTRLLIMPPSSVIKAHTSPQLQQQKLTVLNLCTHTLHIQTTPLCPGIHRAVFCSIK